MRSCLLLFFLVVAVFGEDFEKSIKSVIDQKNQLMWQDTQESALIVEDITMGKIYCDSLVLNGYTDWQMATIEQLYTLIETKESKVAIKKEFENKQGKKYWSKTPKTQKNDQFWYVDFATGVIGYAPQNNKLHIRCVRKMR